MSDYKPRILFILHLPPPVHGAAMVGSFIKDSQLINSCFDASWINLSTSKQLNEIGKSGLSKLTSIITLLQDVFKTLNSRQYQLCYMTLTATGPGFYKDFLIVVLLKLFDIKIVFHFHNKGVASAANKLNKFLYRWVFKNTKSILLSQYLYYDIEKYVAKEDVYFCPNGIPLNGFSGKTSRGEESTCRLLFLSNMMEAKGVFILLEACSLLKEKGHSFECHYVGDWSDISSENFNMEIKRRNLTQEVFAHGKKYGKDKIRHFYSSDIFIFPSYYHNECFPLVLLEAMQYGLPIISTPEGAIQNIVKEGITGYLVPQRDAPALAEKIEFLMINRHLREGMGTAAKKRYEEFFTLERFEQGLNKILTHAVYCEPSK